MPRDHKSVQVGGWSMIEIESLDNYIKYIPKYMWLQSSINHLATPALLLLAWSRDPQKHEIMLFKAVGEDATGGLFGGRVLEFIEERARIGGKVDFFLLVIIPAGQRHRGGTTTMKPYACVDGAH